MECYPLATRRGTNGLFEQYVANNVKTYFRYIHIAGIIVGENSFGCAEVGDYIENLWNWSNRENEDREKHLIEQMKLLRAGLDTYLGDFRNPWAKSMVDALREAGTVVKKQKRVINDSNQDEDVNIVINSPALRSSTVPTSPMRRTSTIPPLTPPDTQLRPSLHPPGPSRFVDKSFSHVPLQFQAQYPVVEDPLLDVLFSGTVSDSGSGYGSGSGSGSGSGLGKGWGNKPGLTEEQWSEVGDVLGVQR